MGFYRKSRAREAGNRRFLPTFMFLISGACILVFYLRTNGFSQISPTSYEEDEVIGLNYDEGDIMLHAVNKLLRFNQTRRPSWFKQTDFSINLEKRNLLPPRNLKRFPNLAKDHVKIVLYVHNRPQYLQIVVDSLSKVEGIEETMLIVSHDGYFEEMNRIVEGIKFCQVKQIFSPYSPHIYPNSFPGISPEDCQKKDDPVSKKCNGNTDQYGNHRSPKTVSLKHHWWWMMNTVWDGLEETWNHMGHILFIEEDHFIYPNAYRSIQLLTSLKQKICRECYAANLAPSDVSSKGEGWHKLIAEKIGNVGYAFNRTVWKKIHDRAHEFCHFDDYNWDITMWSTVYPSWNTPVYTLRGSKRSAAHFGKCGLHQGRGFKDSCFDNGVINFESEDNNRIVNFSPDWAVHVYTHQEGYKAGFKGWGGWGDDRDRRLCLDFASMYTLVSSS